MPAIVGGACVALAQFIFSVGRHELPVTDNEAFQHRESYYVSRSGPRTAGPESVQGSYLLALDVQETTPIHTDVPITLSYKSFEKLEVGELVQAVLLGPSLVEMRTPDRCPNPPQGSLQNIADNRTQVTACVQISKPTENYELHWYLTPKETGRFIFVLNTAALNIGGSGSAVVQFTIGTEQRVVGDFPVKIGNVDVDLSHQQLRFPLEVLPTLGVTQKTYDLIELIGKVLAFFLGSGVVWKIIGLVWREAKPGVKAKPRAKQPSKKGLPG